jgi:hypothetical protein
LVKARLIRAEDPSCVLDPSPFLPTEQVKATTSWDEIIMDTSNKHEQHKEPIQQVSPPSHTDPALPEPPDQSAYQENTSQSELSKALAMVDTISEVSSRVAMYEYPQPAWLIISPRKPHLKMIRRNRCRRRKNLK